MVQFISDKIVCGNCKSTIPLANSIPGVRFCTVNEAIVILAENICDGFTWTGETDSDNRLMVFPRKDRLTQVLNA